MATPANVEGKLIFDGNLCRLELVVERHDYHGWPHKSVPAGELGARSRIVQMMFCS